MSSSSRRSIISLLRKSRSAHLTPFFSNFTSHIPTKQHSRHFIPFKKLPQSYFPSISPPSSSSSFSKNGFIGWYLRMIETRPVLTKSVTASAIFTAADVTSQMITLTSSDSFDPIRTLRMAGYGLLISGPSLHLWFNFVSRILPKRDLSNTMKKLFLGQTTFGPIMTAVFFSVNAALQVGYHVERLGSIEWALDNGSILASVFLIPYTPSVKTVWRLLPG
ncbi:protein SYM1-like isoform X3 [Magnolia sinica]|uniref:protein SYM1-like isoform X3 n=1 Tax=Magnolia sinica TaxID=86752 RepID=UPI002657D7D4|nr:protein SYM1-like isoform X3 [Magnolia sinica]